MRSSAATTVSRTRERIDSLRRRRRGRRVRPPAPREVRRSLGAGIVFVVIFFFSVEKVSRALRGAVSAARGAVGAVGTEVAAAGNTPLEPLRLFALVATDAASFHRGNAEIFATARR